jgi:hypothetical protein
LRQTFSLYICSNNFFCWVLNDRFFLLQNTRSAWQIEAVTKKRTGDPRRQGRKGETPLLYVSHQRHKAMNILVSVTFLASWRIDKFLHVPTISCLQLTADCFTGWAFPGYRTLEIDSDLECKVRQIMRCWQFVSHLSAIRTRTSESLTFLHV